MKNGENIMKAKKRLLLLLALIIIFAVVSATLANENREDRYRNVLTTGEVKISINETTKKGYGVEGVIRKGGIDFTDVLPGQTASKIVTITNDADDCWLRVKVEISVDPAPNDGSDPAALIVPNVDSNKWFYSGGYYYFHEPLRNGNSTDMFDKVLFAPAIGNAYAGKTATMNITAEAIQYKNNEVENPVNAWPAETEGGT